MGLNLVRGYNRIVAAEQTKVSMSEELAQELNTSSTPIYIGVDCSSRAIHVTCVDSEENIVGRAKWASKADDFDERFRQIGLGFEAFIKSLTNKPTVAVESAIFIQNPKSTIEIATVVAAVRLGCALNEVTCVPVDNRHWKKVVIGRGNLNKLGITEYTVAKWGDVLPEQDWRDAACIALWIKRR